MNYQWIRDSLKQLKKQGLYIKIKTIESPIGPRVKINGKWYLNFCSNNYLGLADHPQLKDAAKRAVDKYGVGPAAVRTISGTTELHEKLEDNLAAFKKVQKTVTFQSGFNANLAAIPALVSEGDVIFSDELNHASIIDACRLSKAKVVRYKHLDVKDLAGKVEGNESKGKRLIVTDGVFSMDGDIAPLDEIQAIAERSGCLVMVDDAHGEGVLGRKGRGIVDHFRLHGKVDIEIGTMSKAFGVVGGYAAGKKIMIEWLKQRSRPFLFSSAMTIPDTAACIEAVMLLEKSEKLVKKLWDNADYFKSEMTKLGYNLGRTQTPIMPVMLGEAKTAQKFSQHLFEKGIFAMAIGYPTVPKGKARIRVMISASHDKKHLDDVLEAFDNVGKKLKVTKR